MTTTDLHAAYVSALREHDESHAAVAAAETATRVALASKERTRVALRSARSAYEESVRVSHDE
jgi:hypothetical protein